MTTRLRQTIEKLPIFSALDGPQLENLLAQSRTFDLEKDEKLFHMGGRSVYFYFLGSGRIKISRTTQQGMEKVLMIVHPGQMFAEAVMFMEQGRFPATAEALEPSEVIGFNNQVFTGYLRESHELSMEMLSNLSMRLHKQILEIEQLTMQNATYRLLNFIGNLIPEDCPNSVEVELPGPKGTIASRLSITPETLSRALHALGDLELINLQRKGRTIEIPDVEKFHQYQATH